MRVELVVGGFRKAPANAPCPEFHHQAAEIGALVGEFVPLPAGSVRGCRGNNTCLLQCPQAVTQQGA